MAFRPWTVRPASGILTLVAVPSSNVTEVLTRVLGVSRPSTVSSAYLFGGHAEGRAHADSDIDVGVLLDRVRCPTARSRFEVGIRLAASLAADLHCSDIDIVVLNDAPASLAARIVVHGIRIYCANDEVDHAFRRDSQLLAADLEPFLRRARQLKLASIAR